MFSRACRTSGSLLLLAAVVSGGSNASQPCEEVHDSWVRCVGTTCKPYLSNTALYDVCATGCTNVLKENCALNDSCSISGNTCTTFSGCKLCSQCTTQTMCTALSGCLWTGRVCTFEDDIRPQCTADRAIKEAQSRCNSRKFCSWNVDSSFCIMECTTLSKKTCDAYDTCTYNTATNECEEKPHVVDCTTRHSEHDCAAQHTCVWSPTTKHCSAQVTNPPDACSGFVVEADCDDHNECLWSLGSCKLIKGTPTPAGGHSTPAPHAVDCSGGHNEAACTGTSGCKWDGHACIVARRGAEVLNGSPPAHGPAPEVHVDCVTLGEAACLKNQKCMWRDIVCMAACDTMNVNVGCGLLQGCTWDTDLHSCAIQCTRYPHKTWCEAFPECVWVWDACAVASTKNVYESSPEYKDSPLGQLVNDDKYLTTPRYRDSPQYFTSPEYLAKEELRRLGWEHDTPETIVKFTILFGFLLVLIGSVAVCTIVNTKKPSGSHGESGGFDRMQGDDPMATMAQVQM